MRKMTILFADDAGEASWLSEQGYTTAGSRAEAGRLAPWAAVIDEVDGGWIAYESAEDARIAQQQQ